MKMLSDQELLTVYKLAVEMKLSPEFIKLLLDEMKRRRLCAPDHLKESFGTYAVHRLSMVRA